MALQTEEEDNYFRIFKLLHGLATKAVREKFDRYFPPSTVSSTVTKEEHKLRSYYRRGLLNGSQISLLFPPTGATSSTTYDLTLMICLLRNLTTMQPPANGYDCLPPASELCDGADLARVKFYRNKIAHSDNDTLNTQDFNTVWLDLTGAIIRLGGNKYKAKCDDLSQQKLDADVHVEFMRILQTLKKDVLEEINWLKMKTYECGCYDFHQAEIDEWLKEHNKFVKTDAVDFVLQTIQEKKRITVTGIPGIGKSALIKHVALNLCNEQGYNIIPCTSPTEIKSHYKNDRLQIFVFDDVCGRYVLDQYDVNEWTKLQKSILGILTKGNIRLISSCRLQIFNEHRFQNITLLSDVSCDLSSEKFALTKQQRIDIAHQYLPKDKVKEMEDDLQNCEMLPLMCSLFQTKQGITSNYFFSNPFNVYTNELDKLLFEGSDKICVLFILVVNNGYVKRDWFVSGGRQQIADILDACGVNRGTSRIELAQQFDSLVNTYLTKVENDYKVVHDKLFDFLCFYFGQRLQNELIKYADRKMIYERMFLCKINNCYNEFAVFITEENEEKYFLRICKDISDGFLCDLLYSNSMKLEKFRTIIVNYLKTQNEEDMMKIIKTRQHNCVDTSLQVASSLGYTDIVECMISFIDNINIVLADEFPPLHQACFQGQDKIVKLFIDKGADLNIAGFNGWTPLMWACEGEHNTIVNLLVHKGAHVNAIITGGKTLLTEWCLLGNDRIVDLLIQSGAKVNLLDGTGKTPLTTACSKCHFQIVLLLIQNGADVNLCNNSGKTPIVKAVMNTVNNINSSLSTTEPERCSNSTIFLNDDIVFKVFDLLISFDADVNKPDNEGWTPLQEVCERNNITFIHELIYRGANVNQSSDEIRTPLMMACERGDKEVAVSLIVNGADVNLEDNEGYTSLMLACENNHFGIAKHLILKGAHVRQILKFIDKKMIINHYFDNLIDNLKCMNINWISEACIIGNTDIVSYLINNGATINSMTYNEKCTLLINACNGKHEDIVLLLIKDGIDVNIQIRGGQSALFTACLVDSYKLVELLVNAGANVNVSNKNKETPLIKACSLGNIHIAQILIANSANVNMSDVYGDTALISAVRYESELFKETGMDAVTHYNKTRFVEKQFPVVMVLLRNKVRIDQTNLDGDSPLTIAINLNCVELAVTLVEYNANIHQRNRNGYTPLMLAVKNKSEDIIVAMINKNGKEKGVDIDWNFSDFMVTSVMLKLNNIEQININTRNKDINVLLEIAIQFNQENMVVLLLDEGANVNKPTADGRTPLILAVEYILSPSWYTHIHKTSNFEEQSKDGYSTKIIKVLLGRGAEINAADNNGDTVLGLAIKSRLTDFIMILLDRGVNINTANHNGKTPLMLAVEFNFSPDLYAHVHQILHFEDRSMERCSIEIIKALLDKGAEINAADNDRNTVLGLAIMSRLTYVVMILLEKGADINKVNKDGKTSLMLAVEFNFKLDYYSHLKFDLETHSENDWCTEIINALLDRGAEINAADNNGNTVLGLAIKSRLTDLAIILLDRGADINAVDQDGKTPLILAFELTFNSWNAKVHEIFNFEDKNMECCYIEVIKVLID